MKPGDRVRIVEPHPMAGRSGSVVRVYRANAHYEPRADVDLGNGWQMVALRLLAVVDPADELRNLCSTCGGFEFSDRPHTAVGCPDTGQVR
jgi:hypothetical protein